MQRISLLKSLEGHRYVDFVNFKNHINIAELLIFLGENGLVGTFRLEYLELQAKAFIKVESMQIFNHLVWNHACG